MNVPSPGDDIKQQFLEEGTTEPPAPTKGFPPILEVPGWRPVAALLLVAAFFAISLTVGASWWSSVGVSSDDLIKYGSIPLVAASLLCPALSAGLSQISVGFTYCHIWLALWLTFYPLEYIGVLQIPGTNTGLG